MKNILMILLCIPLQVAAQSDEFNEDTFDFWIGKWQARWTNPDGSTGNGVNHIFRVLDEKVIEENFSITSGNQAGFKGKSLSVFNPRTSTWHQAWTDNQGGYYDFIGEVDGDRKIFKTHPIEKEGKINQHRMIFYNISHEKFTWDWESTSDGGKNWNLLWRINYTRLLD